MKLKDLRIGFRKCLRILSTGAVAGMTIAKFAGKKEQIGGMIGDGLLA